MFEHIAQFCFSLYLYSDLSKESSLNYVEIIRFMSACSKGGYHLQSVIPARPKLYSFQALTVVDLLVF